MDFFIRFKKEKGITLIALVVTIIVLLVLSGISISMLTGENSILKKTGETKQTNEIENEKEKIRLAYISASMKYKTRNEIILKEDIQNELNSLLGENKSVVTNCGNGFEVLIREKNYYYTIEENGNITQPTKLTEVEYAGDITKNGKYDGSNLENAYRIECIEDLVAFSNMVNVEGRAYINNMLADVTSKNKINFDGKTVKLTRNLNFLSKYSYDNAERTDFYDDVYLITKLTTGEGWTPIGKEKTFTGNFKISNLYINGGQSYVGFFGYVKSNTQAIKFENINITGNIYTNTRKSRRNYFMYNG